MKYLIKRYYYYLSELNRRRKVFPNSLNRFFQPGNIFLFILLKEIPYPFKEPAEITFLLAFLFVTTINRYQNEEERLNFNY
jgi:hypothetical protein